VAAYRSALEIYTPEQLPQQWAMIQNNLGAALWKLGKELRGDEGIKRKEESVEAFRHVMACRPSDQSRVLVAFFSW
jgi:hypothetical protein